MSLGDVEDEDDAEDGESLRFLRSAGFIFTEPVWHREKKRGGGEECRVRFVVTSGNEAG